MQQEVVAYSVVCMGTNGVVFDDVFSVVSSLILFIVHKPQECSHLYASISCQPQAFEPNSLYSIYTGSSQGRV